MKKWRLIFKNENGEVMFVKTREAETRFEVVQHCHDLIDDIPNLQLTSFDIEQFPTPEQIEFEKRNPEYTRAIQYLRKNEEKLHKDFVFNLLTTCLCYLDETSIKTINKIWLK